MNLRKINRALISVSDKDGLSDFARGLASRGVEILSTGGTAKRLLDEGIDVTDVSAYTGFPEMMDGRLKTLHPLVHGGLLGRRGVDDEAMQDAGIKPIDLVVVNLYPFTQTISRPDCTLESAIENIDIGGPTMIRAAAKNYQDVTVVVDSGDYSTLLEELEQHGGTRGDTRFKLACKAFSHTARYDGAISNYLTARGVENEAFPEVLNLQFQKVFDMRYGENPHQNAALYRDPSSLPGTVPQAGLLQGKPLSFNNVADADAALECVSQFEQTACVIVKHANPCGVAIGSSLLDTYDKAYSTDPTSAFGGIIAFNRALDPVTAEEILARQFVEVLICPAFEDATLEVLATKPNIRALATGKTDASLFCEPNYKRIEGGLLVQDHDQGAIKEGDLKVVTRRTPESSEVSDLLFCWRVAKFVKSNAIVYARDGRTIGIGAGQMSRVYSAKIAAIKAADEDLTVEGAVMASDAFFPFRDGIDAAADAGITAVIQPGGSMKDDEVVAAADEHNIAMVFTGMRHFRH